MKEQSSYQARLKSFKNSELNKKKVKWPHKSPSMAGMARGFFTFHPAPGVKDQVKCTNCGSFFANWLKYYRNPVEKHAGQVRMTNPELSSSEAAVEDTSGCFVAALGAISLKLSGGTPVQFEKLASACLASFKGGALEGLSRSLASQGFVYMPTDDSRAETIGCIGCLCFPQSGTETPQHAKKCPIPKIIDQEDAETIKAFMENRPHQCTSDTDSTGINFKGKRPAESATVPSESKCCLSNPEAEFEMPAAEAPGLSLAIHETQNLATRALLLDPADEKVCSDVKNVEECKATIEILLSAFHAQLSGETATNKCTSLFSDAQSETCSEILAQAIQYEAGKIDIHTALTVLEDRVIRTIEMTHAKRINLIYMEADKVIQKLMGESV